MSWGLSQGLDLRRQFTKVWNPRTGRHAVWRGTCGGQSFWSICYGRYLYQRRTLVRIDLGKCMERRIIMKIQAPAGSYFHSHALLHYSSFRVRALSLLPVSDVQEMVGKVVQVSQLQTRPTLQDNWSLLVLIKIGLQDCNWLNPILLPQGSPGIGPQD